jgi:hypothetical protein
VNLVEVEGFVPISDPTLEPLRAGLGGALKDLTLMGGYTVPLGAAALASRD